MGEIIGFGDRRAAERRTLRPALRLVEKLPPAEAGPRRQLNAWSAGPAAWIPLAPGGPYLLSSGPGREPDARAADNDEGQA